MRNRSGRVGPPPALGEGLGGPVEYLSNLEPWQSPQYIPPGPHNLPAQGQRLPQRLRGASNGAELIAPSPAFPGTGATTPILGGDTLISDPHHYASLIEYYNAVPQNSTAPIITEALGLRNFLSLRNPSVAANIYVSFGAPADATAPIALIPGQTILFDVVVPQNDIWVFADAAAGFISIAYSTIPG